MADKNHRASDTGRQEQTGERRRVAKIVHDHKGTATVVWHDAPENHERAALAIEDDDTARKRWLNTGSLAIEEEKDKFNPYTREVHGVDTPRPRKTDLRKLSEWIKMMREREDAQKRGDEE